MSTKKKLLQAAAGSAGGAGPLGVEDVFSTYLYEGNGSTQTITNDIDLAGEGGLVWIKSRTGTDEHTLLDTERGIGSYLVSHSTLGNQGTSNAYVTSYNSNGFSLGAGNQINRSATDFASWTFRKAPKFFDVVTYTGDGTTNRDIPHNLGSQPGSVWIKRTDSTSNWVVFHRSFSQPYHYVYLNSSGAVLTGGDASYGAHTSTTIEVGFDNFINHTGGTYVAYLFAHNNGDGEFGPTADQDIIKCGSYTGNGTTSGPEIDLGWEPQWLLIKNITVSNEWPILDNMRGIVSGGNDSRVWANLNSAENTGDPQVKLLPNGFQPESVSGSTNQNGATYIYIAIRRGPMAVPESATDVFAIDTKNSSGDNTDPTWDLGIVTDMAIQKFNKTTSTTPLITSRLTGTNYLLTSETSAETSNSGMEYDYMTGVGTGNGSTTDVNDIVWGWKRAPNYFDVVAYTGNGTAGHTVSHNLGVAPEMMWVKRRNLSEDWFVYHNDLGASYNLRLNKTDAANNQGTFPWNATAPTDSVFTLYNDVAINQSGDTYIAYLFASLDGVSKVGSFSHTTGSATNVDCGFTSGARFVLWKEVNALGGWSVFDTARGIVSGNDAELTLNSTAAESSLDKIDPLSSGFTVSSSVYNDSGNYIFYAIA